VRAAGFTAPSLVRRVRLGLRPAAAAVATALRRAAAAGAASSPGGRLAPAFSWSATSRRAAYAVTRRQARGALRAPLKT
jgi:hypothetical protein